MRKRKKRIVWLVILLVIVLFLTYKIAFKHALPKPLVPIYKITKDGKGVSDIKTVEIDSVVYERVQNTKWSPHGFDELIGYAGDTKWGIYQPNDSVKNNFILLEFHTIMDMRPQPILFRKSTIEIDEPYSENITNIIFSKTGSYNDYDYHKSEVKELVNKIFKHIENGNNISSQDLNHASYKNLGNISFYNNETPGLYYYIHLSKYSNKYYLETYKETKTIPIPKQLGQEIETYFNK